MISDDDLMFFERLIPGDVLMLFSFEMRTDVHMFFSFEIPNDDMRFFNLMIPGDVLMFPNLVVPGDVLMFQCSVMTDISLMLGRSLGLSNVRLNPAHFSDNVKLCVLLVSCLKYSKIVAQSHIILYFICTFVHLLLVYGIWQSFVYSVIQLELLVGSTNVYYHSYSLTVQSCCQSQTILGCYLYYFNNELFHLDSILSFSWFCS